jgi:hypothetical protein
LYGPVIPQGCRAFFVNKTHHKNGLLQEKVTDSSHSMPVMNQSPACGDRRFARTAQSVEWGGKAIPVFSIHISFQPQTPSPLKEVQLVIELKKLFDENGIRIN